MKCGGRTQPQPPEGRIVRATTHPQTRSIITVIVALLACGASLPAFAVNEPVREMRMPQVPVESEPGPELGFEAPPSAYPLQPVEQSLIHGVRHGFVNTTTGGLVFKVVDLRLPGRMPIEMGRIYDSKMSASLPPPPPGKGAEARWTADLGPNWIPSYSAYLIATLGGFKLVTPDGDRVDWELVSGSYVLAPPMPSKYLSLEPGGTGEMILTTMDGLEWTFTLGVNGQGTYGLTEIADRSGNTITLTYTSLFVSRIENSDGASIDIFRPMYDPQHPPVTFPTSRITKLTDNNGREVHYDYYGSAGLKDVTDVRGKEWSYNYSGNDKLISATDPTSKTYLTALYDASMRVYSYTADTGHVQVTYSTGETEVEDDLDNVWTYTFDTGTGITTEIEEPTGGTHTYTLDSGNDPVTYTDPVSAAHTWTYDAKHRPLTYTPPLANGNYVTYVYDSTDDWIDSVTALNGGQTVFTRDSAGRITEELKPDGGKWTSTYASNGDRLTTTLPEGNKPGGSGHQWVYTYDAFGQVETATDPTGREFSFEYAGSGEITKITRPDHEDQGQVVTADWEYVRDLAGNLLRVIDPTTPDPVEPETETFRWRRTYDDAGRLITLEGLEGTTYHYDYDSYFRLTEFTIEIDGVNDLTTTLGYDTTGKLTTKTLPNGATWTYTYDASGRFESVTDPLDRTWSYERDLAGRITKKIFPGGREVTMVRDAAGRLTDRNFPGTRSEDFTYDDYGRLTKAEVTETPLGETTAWNSYVDYNYDVLNRPTFVTSYHSDTSSHEREVHLTYDLNGNRATLSTNKPGLNPDESILYEYDELNRLVATTSDNREDWAVNYDDWRGHRLSVTSSVSGKEELWSYDSAGQVLTHTWDWPTVDAGSLTYGYDEEGRLLSTYDGSTTRTIEYAPLGLPDQIHVFDGTDTTSTSYTYDLVGNILQTDVAINAGAPVATIFDWDDAGRVTYARRGTTIRTYTWEDAPSGQDDVAMKVWRSPNDLTQYAIETDFDYAGRMRSILSHSPDTATPDEVGKFLWAPFEGLTLFRAEEADETGVMHLRNRALEPGGYYAEMNGSSAATLPSPVAVIEVAGVQLRGRAVGGLPAPLAAYGLATAATPLLVDHGSIEMSHQATVATSHEQRPGVTLAVINRPTRVEGSYYDEWLASAVMQANPEGDRTHLQQRSSDTFSSQSAYDNGDPGECASAWWCHALSLPDTNYQLIDPCDYAILEIGLNGGPQTCYARPFLAGGPGYSQECTYPFDRPLGLSPSVRGDRMSEGSVSLLNGDFEHSATDLTVYDPTGNIRLVRSYASGIIRESGFGFKWTHNFDERLFIGSGSHPSCGDEVRWVRSDSSLIDFLIDENGTPTNPPGAFERLLWISEDELHIRSVSGSLRTFTRSAPGSSMFVLQSVTGGGQGLGFVYSGDQLLEVWSGGVKRLIFAWNSSTGLIERVTDAQHTDRYVDYVYNTECRELDEVKQRPTESGYDKNGDPAPVQQPVSYYYYDNVSNSDCLSSGAGTHLLSKIAVSQYDPLTDASSQQVTLQNVYHYGAGGSSDLQYLRVVGQCFSGGSCESVAESDVSYEYLAGGTPGEYTTVVREQRLSPTVEMHYTFDQAELLELVRDATGLGQTTTFQYDNDGLLELVTQPDGSCEVTEYVNVGGIELPEKTISRTKSDCDVGAPGPDDRITYRTYDSFGGRLRTLSPPSSFPNGVVPVGFDPFTDPYTDIYDYDYHQTSSTGAFPQDMADELAAWGLPDPDKLGNVNAHIDATGMDDSQWFGRVVRARRWNPVEAGYVATLTAHQASGRVVESQQVFFEVATGAVVNSAARTSRTYYTGSQTTIGSPTSATGAGPLATMTSHPTQGTGSFITSYGWEKGLLLTEERDHTDVSRDKVYSAAGKVLQEQLSCLPGVGSCPSEDSVLRTTQYSYDLRGRLVRTANQDGSGQPIDSIWMTYSTLGSVTSSTLDPDISVDPGDPVSGAPTGGALHARTLTRYDAANRLVKTISPEGRVECTEYDALDRVSRTWQSASADNGLTHCDPPTTEDPVSTTLLDAVGRPFRMTDPNGSEIYIWYDALGRPEYLSDGKPPASDFASVVFLGTPPPQPPDATWWEQLSYDGHGQLTKRTFYADDGSGQFEALSVEWTSYDSTGRATGMSSGVTKTGPVVPAAAASAATPPAPGSVPDFEVATKTLQLDELGRVTSEVEPAGRATTYSYDSFDRLDWVKTPPFATDQGIKNDRLIYGYDSATGRLASTTAEMHDPEGQMHVRSTQAFHDEWGRVVRSKVGTGIASETTTFEYDALDREIRRVQRWVDAASYPALDPYDRVSDTRYDPLGRVDRTSVRVDAGTGVFDHTEATYDLDGNLTSLTDARGATTDYTFDQLGRLTKTSYPSEDGVLPRQGIYTSLFDLNGNPKAVHFRKDVDDADSATITWTLGYDDYGRLTQRVANIDPAQETYTFAGATQQTFSYDALGRLVSTTDHTPGLPASDQDIFAAFTFSSASQVLAEHQFHPGSSTSHDVLTNYLIDGAVESTTWPAYSPAGVLQHRYVVEFVNDDLGRVHRIRGPTSSLDTPASAGAPGVADLATYHYVGALPWDRSYANGTSFKMYEEGASGAKPLLYDTAMRPIGIRNELGAETAEFRYGYDRVGNLMFEERRHEEYSSQNPVSFRARALSYDLQNRLVEWSEGEVLEGSPIPPTHPNPAEFPITEVDRERWILDAVGNWDEHAIGVSSAEIVNDYATANAINQYTAVNSAAAFAHDWVGQLRSDSSTGTTREYVWDAFGRVAQVRVNGSVVSEYRYDALDRRIEKKVTPPAVATDSVTRVIYDGWRAIEERAVDSGEEVVRARYGFGLELDEILWMDRDVARDTATSRPDPANGVSNGSIESRYYAHHDYLGSVVATTSDPGNDVDSLGLSVVERFTYSAYGETDAWWGDSGAPAWDGEAGYGQDHNRSKVGLPFLFAGQRFDSEVDLYYSKYRMYDPRTGRFLRRDPLGYADGPNPYQYAQGSPAMLIDSYGLIGHTTGWVPGFGEGRYICGFLCSDGGQATPETDKGKGMPDYDKDGDGFWDLLVDDFEVEVDDPIPDPIDNEIHTLDPKVPEPDDAPTPPGSYRGGMGAPPDDGTRGFDGFLDRAGGFLTGEPSLIESSIPVYGDLRNSIHHYSEGHWVRGSLYAVSAGFQAFGVGVIAKAGGKLTAHAARALLRSKTAARSKAAVTRAFSVAKSKLTTWFRRGKAKPPEGIYEFAARGGVGEGTKVYRVWGDGAAANGRSWTTVNPGSVPNYRGAAGLPSQNTGRFVSEGVIQDATGVTTRSSLPLGGNSGGLPEVLIPNPANQVRLTGVSGVNPPF